MLYRSIPYHAVHITPIHTISRTHYTIPYHSRPYPTMAGSARTIHTKPPPIRTRQLCHVYRTPQEVSPTRPRGCGGRRVRAQLFRRLMPRATTRRQQITLCRGTWGVVVWCSRLRLGMRVEVLTLTFRAKGLGFGDEG